MWIDAEEVCFQARGPVIVLDANGMIIWRLITAIDPETGEVESFVLGREERPLAELVNEHTVRRREVYPAPLRWQRITAAQVQAWRGRLWDWDGR
jgi:hypothetical protein